MSAMSQAFNVTFLDGSTVRVTSSAGDVIRLYQWANGEVDGNNPANHGYLIWLAAVRTKVFDGDFDAFLDALDDYEAADVPKAPSKKRSP